jgi:hypothetical protein
MPRLGNTIAVGAAVMLATGVLAAAPADATVSPFANCRDWGTTGTAGDIVGAFLTLGTSIISWRRLRTSTC